MSDVKNGTVANVASWLVQWHSTLDLEAPVVHTHRVVTSPKALGNRHLAGLSDLMGLARPCKRGLLGCPRPHSSQMHAHVLLQLMHEAVCLSGPVFHFRYVWVVHIKTYQFSLVNCLSALPLYIVSCILLQSISDCVYIHMIVHIYIMLAHIVTCLMCVLCYYCCTTLCILSIAVSYCV